MSEYHYNMPDFLKNQSVNEIHQRMLNNLPNKWDKSEGQIAWDMTRPAAIEKAEYIQFRLNEAIRIRFPQWAYGKFLDWHAELASIKRREANKASGFVEVSGVPGTEIASGLQLATPADESILFETTADLILDETGLAIAPVSAVQSGRNGNVPPNSITLLLEPVSGIKTITNPKSITGGAPAENDETLRVRVMEALQTGISYAGTDVDYIRWAKETPGVGSAVVVAEHEGPGTVLLVLTDINGEPANDVILNAVYEHIISPNNRSLRLAPIGAILTVSAAELVEITISARIKLKDDYIIEQVAEEFINSLRAYFPTAVSEGAVKYVHVGSLLARTEGVLDYDYGSLLVNEEKENIPISPIQCPMAGAVVFYE